MSQTPPHYLHNRRWYDQIGQMTLALHISQQLPEPIQLVIARSLNETIDVCRKRKRSDKHAVSLGQQRIMGLYKAGKRLRCYDPVHDLHRAFTHMATVPDPMLEEFAGRVLSVGHYIQEQRMLSHPGSHYLWVDTVESILQQSTVSIEESQDGIKLVSGQHGHQPSPNRHIVPVRQHRSQHPPK